jgi:hypothetical protein
MPLSHGPAERNEAPRRPSHPKRSSIADISILRRLAILGVLLGGIGELSQPKPQPERPPIATRTVEDFLSSLQSAIGYTTIEEHSAPPDDPTLPPDPGIAPGAMAKAALLKTWEWGKQLWSKPSDTTGETSNTIGKTATYLQDYRLNEGQAIQRDPQELDCNDHANIACERLERLGVPTYLLAIWPEDPAERFNRDWHEMAVCKLRHQCYLIFDDHRTTLWRGSLNAFVLQYGSRARMRIIPHVGISEYAEPKYDNFISKLLVQGLHGVRDETEMKSLNLLFRREILQIAKR